MWKFKNPIKHAIPETRWPTAAEAAKSLLLQPIAIGPIEAGSRTWVPAMVPWRATEDGFVTPEVLAWYERFAAFKKQFPELAKAAAALLADFGASDAALLEVVFGRTTPTGVLPFELPSSMDAVRRQLPDVPYDSEDPLFPFGDGLSYDG